MATRKMVSAAQVADALGVAGSTVRQYVRDGLIPVALKTPGGHARFFLDDVKVALTATTETPADSDAMENQPIARRTFTPVGAGGLFINLDGPPLEISEDWQLAFGVAAASVVSGDRDRVVDPVVGVRGSGRFAVDRELAHA